MTVEEASYISVVLEEDRHRYTISVDGEPAGLATFVDHGRQRVFLHTEVDKKFAGQGLAGILVTEALDNVRDSDKRVVALCPYVSAYLRKHDEYAELVDQPSPELLETLSDE